jgi:hypothetical protein
MPASWQSASQRSGSPTQMEVFGSRNGIMHHLIISQNFLFGLWSEMDTYRHLIFHKLIISSDIIFKKFNSWETPQTPVKRERETPQTKQRRTHTRRAKTSESGPRRGGTRGSSLPRAREQSLVASRRQVTPARVVSGGGSARRHWIADDERTMAQQSLTSLLEEWYCDGDDDAAN